MHIDSDKIKEAKEKLGNRNAELIAQILNLSDYDEKNMKSCCPYHHEDTPSFIYNPKNLNFHCFRGDTRVITRQGTKEISEIVNENVEIINGNGEWETTCFKSYGVQKLMRLSLQTRQGKPKVIYCTDGHEWVQKRHHKSDVKVKTKDLKVGDFLRTQWLHYGNHIEPSIEGMRHGFVYGDGVLGGASLKNGYHFYARVWDKDKWDFCQRIFNSFAKNIKDEKCYGVCTLYCNYDAKKIPPITSSKEYIMGFLIGYYMADGNCTDGTIQIASAKKDDLLKIRDLFTVIGIPSYMIGEQIRTNKSNMGIIKLKEPHTMYNLRLIRSEIPDNFYPVEKSPKNIGFGHSYLSFKVTNVEETDLEEEVFCCVTSTHTFVLEDFLLTGNCFGCGVNVDIIDAFMQSGLTYIKACQMLFKEAGMDVPFGEAGVKTKVQYRYPHSESGDIEPIHEYFNKRGISDDTLEYLGIGSDGHGNAVFNYYDDNDVLTMVKYRPARTVHKGEPKMWCQKDADTSPLLFNMNRVNVAQPLLITEGEADTASAIEAGWFNVVSIPLGAHNTHWIEECWEWLEQFESIIIAFDNDEAGQKARKDVIYRLGTWRTKYIDYPKRVEKDGKVYSVKDMNDCLQAGGASFVLNMITNAKDIPVSSVVDFTDVDDLDVSDMTGVTTGIKPLDKKLIKIFDGTLTILSGRPGSGKTSLIDQSIATAIDDGNSVFLFSKEMPERMSTNWFNYILAGRRNLVEKVSPDGEKYNVVSFEAKQKIKEFYRNKLYIYKDSEPNDIESVKKSMEECVRKYGVKYLVIDNLMMLDLQCSEEDKNTAQTNLINDLIRFASKFNVAVVLIAHPRKTSDMQSDIEMYDIAGSSNIINLAMRSIGLRRVSKKEKEDENCKWRNYNVVLTIMKDRLLGKADMQMGLYYDVVSRRFFTDYDEFDYQYRWDTNNYTDTLEMPVEIEENPFE